MTIWIDADACPRVIREIVFRASKRLKIPVRMVANKEVTSVDSGLVTSVVVEEGFDVADDYIVQHAAADDLVITSDIPLAARIVAIGGAALDPRGELYTERNIGERLALRDLMQQLRTEGLLTGGPGQLGRTDRNRFGSALDRVLTRMKRGETPEEI